MLGTDQGRKKAKHLFLACLSAVSAFAVVSGFAVPDAAQAQGIDASVIKQFEQKLQRGGRSTQVSPVDQSRDQEAEIDSSQPMTFDVESRLRLAKPSIIEQDYENRSKEKLPQFGYDFFGRKISGNLQATGRIPSNYVVGIGDEVVVTLNGPEPRSITTAVDSEGRILIEGLPSIPAAGRRFGELEADIKARTRAALIGTEAFVSIGGARSVSVYVVGEVERPGFYRLTSMSSLLEALSLAGGVKKTGSLRSIKIGSRNVDLYHVFNGSSAVDLHLVDGVRIVVPPIGSTVAVAGGVVRPGIYELPKGGSQSLSSILAMAGGSVRPRGFNYVLNRVEADGRQFISTVASVDQAAHDGDILTVSLRQDVQMGGVELTGHVRTDGMRSLREAPTIKDLLGDGMMMKDNPYMLFGVVESTDPTTQARLMRAFSPEQVIYGQQNFPLRDRDRVILFGQSHVDFLTTKETRHIVLTGYYGQQKTDVRKENADRNSKDKYGKGVERCEPLEELTRLVTDTRSDRYITAIRSVYTQVEDEERDTEYDRKLKQQELLQKQQMLQQQQLMGVTNTSSLSNESAPEDEEKLPKTAEEIEAQKKREQDERERLCPSIYRDVKGLLPFLLEYVAAADGALRRPGVYPLVGGTSLSSLVAVAGGTTFNADLTAVELIGSDIAPEKGQSATAAIAVSTIDATMTDLSRITLGPSSAVRFNSKVTQQEAGAVLLSGEFKRPGVYPIRRGEKLSDIIARAGGLSEQAYPYGAVFTRTRVKEEQKRGFERSSRELNLGLATAALRKSDMQPETLMAAQQLGEKLSSVDVIGRVVIEADPRVLAERPELDTILEPGDRIVMPKRPNHVLMIGDLLNPGALQFMAGKNVKDYVRESGGPLPMADEDRIFVVYPNGVARPVKLSSWGFSSSINVPPGTAIVVPKDMTPIDTLQLVRDITAIVSQLAVSAASIAVISSN